MRRTFAFVGVAAAIAVAAPGFTKDFTVNQKDKNFSEAELKIAVGDSVTFVNSDDITHNVYSVTKGMEFDLRTQAPGKSSTIKFDKAGQLLVECAIHPKMKLPVKVGG
jgi:plastocyanin